MLNETACPDKSGKSRLSATKTGFAGKKLILLFTTFLLLQLNTPAQEGWFWQHPLPQGNDLRDVFVLDENTIFAVGDCGTIIKTTNCGENWDIITYGIYDNLHSIHFTDENTGWIVGDEGLILKSSDSGDSWIIR